MNIAAPDAIPIEQAARAANISAGTLRMWEQRYHWPVPRRLDNGFRVYTRQQVDDLCRVMQLVMDGYAVSQVIVDGLPKWPRAKDAPTPRWQVIDLMHTPSATACKFRDRVVRMAANRREAELLRLVHLAPLALRRGDRALGGWVPIEAALQEWERVRMPLPRAGAIRFAMRTLAAPNWHAVPEQAAVLLMGDR